jgi:cytochrome c oxidase subunit IV
MAIGTCDIGNGDIGDIYTNMWIFLSIISICNYLLPLIAVQSSPTVKLELWTTMFLLLEISKASLNEN